MRDAQITPPVRDPPWNVLRAFRENFSVQVLSRTEMFHASSKKIISSAKN